MLWDPLNVWPAGRRWLWAALALIVCLLQGPDFIRSLRPHRGLGVDFFQEWASARNFLGGLPVYMSQEATAKLYLGYERKPEDALFVEKNAHPPTSILLIIPFGLLDYPDAVLAWNLVSLALFAMSLWLVGRGLGIRWQPWATFPGVALLLLCNPFRSQVHQGQLNLVLLGLVTGIWMADRSGRPWWAGSMLGAAAAIKLFPGYLFVYFVLRRRWGVVGSGILGFLAITASTAAVLGADTYYDYFYDVIPSLYKIQGWWRNASAAGFWLKWFATGTDFAFVRAATPTGIPALVRIHVDPALRDPCLARSGIVISNLILICILYFNIRKNYNKYMNDYNYSLIIIMMLIASPITWDHYFLLLLLPLARTWATLSEAAWSRSAFLAVLSLIWIDPYPLCRALLPAIEGIEGGSAASVLSLLVVSTQFLALVGALVLVLLTEKKSNGNGKNG